MKIAIPNLYRPLPPRLPFAVRRLLLQEQAVEQYRAGESLLRPGQPVNRIWYLKKGLAKRYIIDEAGQEQVKEFYEAGSLLCMEEKIASQSRSEGFIVLLEDAALIPLSYPQCIHLLEQHPSLYNWLIYFFCAALFRRDRRIWLLGLPADQRYLAFIRLFPASRLYSKDIASYLNLSAGGLSRIKKRV